MTMTIAVCIGLLVLVFSVAFYIVGYKKGKSANEFVIINAEKERLNEYWKQRYREVSQINMQKDAEIKELRRKYNRLMDEIKRKTQAKQDIKAPESLEELKQRFEALGYKVEVRKIEE
jgi:uncharacterized protein YdcH (DUF465 family)